MRWTELAQSTKLGQAAAAATVMLYLAHEAPNTDANKRKQLLARSDAYFQQAVSHLSDSAPLEGQIAAVVDLWAHQVLAVSPQAANAVLAIGDLFVMQARGVNPPLDLDTLVDHEKACLRLFAYLDILRCVTQPTRTMVFDYVGLPGFGGATGADQSAEGGPTSFSTWFGLPGPLVSCLAACVRLVQMRSHMTLERAEATANAIESTIREWRLPRVDPRAFSDSVTMVSHTVTLEMVRSGSLRKFANVR